MNTLRNGKVVHDSSFAHYNYSINGLKPTIENIFRQPRTNHIPPPPHSFFLIKNVRQEEIIIVTPCLLIFDKKNQYTGVSRLIAKYPVNQWGLGRCVNYFVSTKFNNFTTRFTLLSSILMMAGGRV